MDFSILASSSWAPGLSSAEDWVAWRNGETSPVGDAPPDLSHIKPMQRRRLSLTARAAFAVGYECLQIARSPTDVHCIFSNAYGPTPMTANLLESIARGEKMSPTSFSISVHNAIGGQFSIAHAITAPSTSIAPGQDGVGAAFIEALGWLHTHPHLEVLICFYETPLDERLKPFENPLPTPLATAVLLSGPQADGGQKMNMARLAASAEPTKLEATPHWRQILELGAFLGSSEVSYELTTPAARYRWQKQP